MRIQEAAAPTVAPIVTGYFRERPNYHTWRSSGTGDWLLMLTLGGEGRIGYAGGERIVRVGEIAILSPGTRHDYGTARGTAGWELLWAHFLPYPHWAEWLLWPEIAPGVDGIGWMALSGETRDVVTHLCWEMHRRASGGLTRREAFAMNALEEALLHCDRVNPRQSRATRDPRVEQARQYLRAHLAEPVNLPGVARSVGLSASRLAHLFREQIGETPGQFLERERMERARQLLTLTTRPVAAIAGEVGFESPFYFTLRFRKHLGVSPREYRRQYADPSDRDTPDT
ncbi:MAG: helix-turn-helix domain-containing protein [Capsulimonadales bacterium]|nr:helix-turn-helix domain-containing protein [Capsulimonadales bacterium]